MAQIGGLESDLNEMEHSLGKSQVLLQQHQRKVSTTLMNQYVSELLAEMKDLLYILPAKKNMMSLKGHFIIYNLTHFFLLEQLMVFGFCFVLIVSLYSVSQKEVDWD